MFYWHQIPALKDNYIYVLEETNTKKCIVIDPGEFHPVQNFFSIRPDLIFSYIFITHHHSDHVGGVKKLKEEFSEIEIIGPNYSFESKEFIPGQEVMTIERLGISFQIHALPGHTLDHVAYHSTQLAWLFSGDVLFSLGCGRIFEGTKEQMFQSIEWIKALPDQTLIFSAHEYTQKNLEFSLRVFPNDSVLKGYKILKGKSTVPVKLENELKNNLFFRLESSDLKQSLGLSPTASSFEVFSTLRDLRNHY